MLPGLCLSHDTRPEPRTSMASLHPDFFGRNPFHRSRWILHALSRRERSTFVPLLRRRETPAQWLGQIRPTHLEMEDDLPKKRRAFYAKYFKGRGSFLSLKFLPHFLALHGTAVDPGDAVAFYNAGRISHDALELWQALGKLGALATLELRHASKMETQTANKRFKKAMLELQGRLIVTHSGAEQETKAW